MSELSMAAAASLEAHRTRAVIDLHGPEEAAARIKGRIAANLVALFDLEGPHAAMSYFNMLGAAYLTAPEDKALRIAVSNSAEKIA